MAENSKKSPQNPPDLSVGRFSKQGLTRSIILRIRSYFILAARRSSRLETNEKSPARIAAAGLMSLLA